jgi:hypothetical protein
MDREPTPTEAALDRLTDLDRAILSAWLDEFDRATLGEIQGHGTGTPTGIIDADRDAQLDALQRAADLYIASQLGRRTRHPVPTFACAHAPLPPHQRPVSWQWAPGVDPDTEREARRWSDAWAAADDAWTAAVTKVHSTAQLARLMDVPLDLITTPVIAAGELPARPLPFGDWRLLQCYTAAVVERYELVRHPAQ